jgi:hypothetical protein
MNIDSSNYEIWLIDWLDGNLNSLQVEELKLYLEQNSDIREEFNDLASMILMPADILFPHKEHLIKSPSDMSGSQFEYLCTAYLENDLTDSQQVELLDIVIRYPDRKKTFDLIQQTILLRGREEYRYKSLLHKRTIFHKGIWLTVAGLGTAAAIFLIIIVFSAIYETSALKINTSSHNFVPDSTLQRSSSVMAKERILTENRPVQIEKKSKNRFVSINNMDKANASINILAPSDDSTIRKTENKTMTLNKVPVHPQVNLLKETAGETLIASNLSFTMPDVENERSRAGRFISRTFREKLLKEKTPPDSPLKGYEIAEAGVTGLNKLFGWQMVLVMKNDDKGQPSSVYFNSKILKVNAPVKKKEPQP